VIVITLLKKLMDSVTCHT